MLILTRRPGETICIGDDIEILIKEVRRNHVRIGINAPKHIQIRRADGLSETTPEATVDVEVNTDSVPEAGTDNVPEAGTDNVPEAGTDSVPEAGTDNVPETSTDDAND